MKDKKTTCDEIYIEPIREYFTKEECMRHPCGFVDENNWGFHFLEEDEYGNVHVRKEAEDWIKKNK